MHCGLHCRFAWSSAILVAALIAGWPDASAQDAAAQKAQELPGPQLVGRMPDDTIPESSGLVKSPRHTGLFWTHNDSGGGVELFAVDATGQLRATAPIRGARCQDWEDIACDERGLLIVGDIGDNARRRAEVVLYRLAEPDPANPQVSPRVQTFRVRYPKEVGSQDAEALVARAGVAFIFTKEGKRVRALRVALPDVPPAGAQEAQLAGETDAIGLVTAADLTLDGHWLALLTYTKVLVIELAVPLGQPPAAGQQAPPLFEGRRRARGIALGKAEAIAWDGGDLVITTEGGEVWRIRNAK